MQFPLLLIGLFLSSFVTGVRPVAAQTDTMFPDVPKDHWAYESVKALKEMGILQGYPPEPKRGQKRATQARPTFHATVQEPSRDLTFVDVPKDHWAYASVIAFQQRGLLEGYPKRYFLEGTVTRYEIAVAIRRVLDRYFGEKRDPKTIGIISPSRNVGKPVVPPKPLTPSERVLLWELLDEFRGELRSLSSGDRKNIERYERLLLP